MQNEDLGSGPTIQSYVTKLAVKEFITRKISEEDKRIVFLEPTEKAMNMFRELSGGLQSEKSIENK